MLTRRKLLQMNAALLALPVASKVAAGTGAPPLTGNVFFDGRIRDCAVFADHAIQAGATARSVADEITAQLYEAIKLALAHESGIIAGLTPEPVAFLFQVMAHDADQQLALFGEHYYAGEKLIGHHFAAPEQLARNLLPGFSDHWTGDLVERFSQFEPAHTGSAVADARLPATPAPQHDLKLVSWVIAPLPKA